jgi:hypothetical protein
MPKTIIPFGATKIYFVYTSTKGNVGSVYARQFIPSNNRVILWGKTAKDNFGWMNLDHCFLTKEQALNDWRRRSNAESKEHVEAIRTAGYKLIEMADSIKVRELDDWHNL